MDSFSPTRIWRAVPISRCCLEKPHERSEAANASEKACCIEIIAGQTSWIRGLVALLLPDQRKWDTPLPRKVVESTYVACHTGFIIPRVCLLVCPGVLLFFVSDKPVPANSRAVSSMFHSCAPAHSRWVHKLQPATRSVSCFG